MKESEGLHSELRPQAREPVNYQNTLPTTSQACTDYIGVVDDAEMENKHLDC